MLNRPSSLLMVPVTNVLSLADLKITLTKGKGALVLASFRRPERVILGFWEKRNAGRNKSAPKSDFNLSIAG